MTPKSLTENLGGNNYRWDYAEFCRQTKLAPGADSSVRLWKCFKQAAAALEEFDGERLDAIFSPKETGGELPSALAEGLDQFKREWAANARESEGNSLMDSGWSGATTDRCQLRSKMLLRDLVIRLAGLPTTPADMFDRPELVCLIEAARFATGKA